MTHQIFDMKICTSMMYLIMAATKKYHWTVNEYIIHIKANREKIQ